MPRKKSRRRQEHSSQAKRELKRGLMQELLTGRRRFPEFSSTKERINTRAGSLPADWGVAKLGEHASDDPSVTAVSLAPKGRWESSRVWGSSRCETMSGAKDLSRYKVVPPNAFRIQPMRINIGSIARSHFAEDCLVSPDYVVFETDRSTLLPEFLDHLRHSFLWRRFVVAAGAGSVAGPDLLPRPWPSCGFRSRLSPSRSGSPPSRCARSGDHAAGSPARAVRAAEAWSDAEAAERRGRDPRRRTGGLTCPKPPFPWFPTFAPASSEDATSQIPALDLLQQLGWTYLSPAEVDERRGGRRSEVVLRSILRSQLAKLNRFEYRGREYPFTEGAIEDALHELTGIGDDGLVRTNERIWNLLRLGKSIPQTVEGDRRSYTVRYVDWEHPENNLYHVTEEFAVEATGSTDTRRPDMCATSTVSLSSSSSASPRRCRAARCRSRKPSASICATRARARSRGSTTSPSSCWRWPSTKRNTRPRAPAPLLADLAGARPLRGELARLRGPRGAAEIQVLRDVLARGQPTVVRADEPRRLLRLPGAGARCHRAGSAALRPLPARAAARADAPLHRLRRRRAQGRALSAVLLRQGLARANRQLGPAASGPAVWFGTRREAARASPW
jgi:hypothetical protein